MLNAKPLDILMITDVYYPRVNGVSTSIRTFRREFEQLGHRVRLIAPAYPGHHDSADAVQRIPSRYLPLDPEDRLMVYAPLIRLEDELRRNPPDLIHIQTPFIAHRAGVRLARRLGLPVVESYHTYFEEYFYHYIPFLPQRLLRYAARRLSRAQCNRLDGMVVPSQAMLDVLREYGVSAPAQVIPTGIDLARFAHGDGAAFRARWGIAAERPVLLFVGRVAFEKNIGFLFEALLRVRLRHPNTLLVVCGEGPALPSLRRRAAALGLAANVLFVGYLREAGDLCDCYAAADIFVFASHTETQGLVLLEAMALGVPVVALPKMGVGDIIAPGKGALAAQDDPADFDAQTLRLLDHPELHARLVEEARAYAKTWSAPALAERMLDFYRNIIEAA
jgi:1,2-diacylglycerol 3-alpha-glucosyltransferase